MLRTALLAAGLAASILSTTPALGTTLAFEFGSAGAGFSIESAPRQGAGREASPERRNREWGWDRGVSQERTLTAHDIRRALEEQGFRDVRDLQRRGAIYQAQARDRAGVPVGLVVNARNGAILNVYRSR